MSPITLRFLLALVGLIAVLAALIASFLLASAGHSWAAVAVGSGGVFGVVKALFVLLEKLGA